MNTPDSTNQANQEENPPENPSQDSHQELYSPKSFHFKQISVSPEAIEIVRRIQKTRDRSLRRLAGGFALGSCQYRKEYAIIALLANAKLNNDGPVSKEELAEKTGYSIYGIAQAVLDAKRILQSTRHRINGIPSRGWSLV